MLFKSSYQSPYKMLALFPQDNLPLSCINNMAKNRWGKVSAGAGFRLYLRRRYGSVQLFIRACRTDTKELAVCFFGKHDAGGRIQQSQPHGNAVAVRACSGIPPQTF